MNILTLSTYPIDIPQHGGQHRLFNIVRLFREAGHTVQVAGVLGSTNYPKSQGFADYPSVLALAAFIENPFLMDDWAIGRLFADNDYYFSQLADLITITPDVIHVEQPWLFAFAERYRKKRLQKVVKILYGSANIEHNLKYDILKTYTNVSIAENGAKKVLDCEIDALRNADGVCCVSEHELQWSRDKTKVPIVLAQNGVKDTPVTLEGIKEANSITGHKKTALYCASAHPPNIKGFYDVFGNGIGCLAPEEIIVVAGSAGASIKDDSRYLKTAGLKPKYIAAGLVSEGCLQGLLQTAHTVILPITHGGGTNLKTAEALWAGRHVVATPVAMRGFENFSSAKGVYVEESPEKFCKAIRMAMSEVPMRLSDYERSERSVLLWESTLTSLLNMIKVI